MSKLRLLVVIINYKTPGLIKSGLESLSLELNHETDKVVVVDNASKDGSVEALSEFILYKKWNNWVTLVPSSVNGGFSAGNNIGINAFNADYYLLLNSDAWVRPGAVGSMLNAMFQRSTIGIIGPRLEWENSEQQVSCFYNATAWTVLLNVAKTGILTKFLQLFGVYEIAIPTTKKVSSPEWISFACVLVRGQLIKDIGLMDDGFFMYMEDIDYCRRTREAGWDILFLEDARVVHLNNGYSNSEGIKRLPQYFYQSRSRYFIKYYGRLGLLATNILWYLGRSLSMSREYIQGKERSIPIDAYKDIWTGFWAKIMRKGNE